MTRKSYAEFTAEDARLVVLRELYMQTDGSLNDVVLHEVLNSYGHNKPREWVRNLLRDMEQLEAVQNRQAGSVMIATITKAGVEHVLRRRHIEGIKQPALGV